MQCTDLLQLARWFSASNDGDDLSTASAAPSSSPPPAPFSGEAPPPTTTTTTTTTTTSAPSHGHPLHWDPAKITVAPDVAADRLFLRNVARGLIVTGKVWPLVFSSSSSSSDDDAAVHPDARHRTIGFLRRAVKDPAAVLGPLDAAQRRGVAVSVRDLWLACDRRLFDDPAELADMTALATAMVDVLEDSFLPRASAHHVHVSFFPRRSCRVLRFAPAAALEMEIGRDAGRQADGEAETEVDKEAVRLEHPFAEHAAGGAADGAAEPLYYTWVDASDLSYHNFESILPLDRILRRPGGAQPSDSDSPLSLSLSNVKRLHPQMDVFSGTLSGTDLPLLYQLDGLGLYLEPANSGQRGGKRMIFNSAALARGLTTAARWSQLFKIMSDDENNDSDDDDDDDEDSVVDNGTVVSGVSDSDSLCKDFDGDSSADSADVLSDHCDAPTKPSLTQGGVSSVEAQIVSASESTADATVRETEADENGYGETSPPSEIDNAAEEQGGQTEDIDADSETASHLDGESETSRSFHSAGSENGASQLNESPWATSNRFCFVNDVFRLNKFEPTDRRFRLHRDTPYYDGVRGLVSKYTMLIYLSAGETPSGSLTIYDGSDLRAGEEMGESDSKKCVVENIASAQCIIFDQRYPHEGDPFDSGAKIFLRTELIYWLPRSVKHVPLIGSLFSSAVYYTLQSVFDNELAKHADRLYESANRSHWGLPETTDLDSDDLEPVLFKKWRGLDFATDGYSYWFPMPSVSVGSRRESGAGPIIAGTSIEQYIKQCAVLVVLDFFNGKLSEMGDSFRKDCKTTSAIPPKRSTAASLESWVLRHLRSAECKHPPIPREREHRNTVLLKHENSADPERRMWAKQQDESFDRSDLDCCLYHGRDPKPWTCKHSFDEYVFWMETALTKTRSAAIVILGRELSYDPEAVVVCGNAVRFCGKDLGRWGVPSFNFAACQSFGDFERSFVKRKYVGLRAEMSGLPPLPFEFVGAKTGGVRGVRFRAEFFKNDWAVSIKGGTVKVPVFMDY